MSRVAVLRTSAELADRAGELALELRLPLTDERDAGEFDALLTPTSGGLQIQPHSRVACGPIRVDFGSAAMRHRRRGGQNELLGRAVGITKRDHLVVVDATAGLGRDSFVLADLGCEVRMIERSPLAYALLRDGLERGAASDDPWLQQVCSRLQLVREDSNDALRQLKPDVVYLDPMFPERKKSARVKKEMWLFQGLLDDDGDSGGLLQSALEAAAYRVVVKRPLKAPPLGGRTPGFSISGRAVRFDVYVCG